jgi:hypothetical protein
MRYWLDTEFIDSGFGPIELISIGMVAEDGREYYAVNRDCAFEKADSWVQQHVLSQVERELAVPRDQIRDEVLAFVGTSGPSPEFWGYITAFDWVVFCHLFGPMSNLPQTWPKFCRDIKQWAEFLGADQLPGQIEGHHHALWDARWNRLAWEYLETLSKQRRGLASE